VDFTYIVLEKIKCLGPIQCQKENTQAGTCVSSEDSLSLSEISGSLALNSVNPDFTPCFRQEILQVEHTESIQ